jgi:hypothetical protein
MKMVQKNPRGKRKKQTNQLSCEAALLFDLETLKKKPFCTLLLLTLYSQWVGEDEGVRLSCHN